VLGAWWVARDTGSTEPAKAPAVLAASCAPGKACASVTPTPAPASATARPRQLAPPGFVIGRSVHSVEEAIGADGADYLVAGAVFPSASKPLSTRWMGVDGLGAIVCTARVPVLAIGGISGGRIDAIAAVGAAGFAAIGLFSGTDGSVVALRQVVGEARRRFDSVKTAP